MNNPWAWIIAGGILTLAGVIILAQQYPLASHYIAPYFALLYGVVALYILFTEAAND